MNKSILILALAIFLFFLASCSICAEESSDTGLIYSSDATFSETVSVYSSDTTFSDTESFITDDSPKLNVEIISYIGKPFSFFRKKFGCRLEDLKDRGEGPPVGEYVSDGITYIFNNMAGYDPLTEETPCAEIYVPYTKLLIGSREGKLTKKIIAEVCGSYVEQYGRLAVYYSDDVVIWFDFDDNNKIISDVSLGLIWPLE